MSCINKLVIYKSAEALNAHAAGYPNLWNFNPATNTGNSDDGCGHYANVTFAVVTSNEDIAKLPAGPFDNVDLVGFGVPHKFFEE
jgi:hypothetical protein